MNVSDIGSKLQQVLNTAKRIGNKAPREHPHYQYSIELVVKAAVQEASTFGYCHRRHRKTAPPVPYVVTDYNAESRPQSPSFRCWGVMSFTGVASTSGANQCTSTPVIIGLLSLPISRHPTAIVGEDSII